MTNGSSLRTLLRLTLLGSSKPDTISKRSSASFYILVSARTKHKLKINNATTNRMSVHFSGKKTVTSRVANGNRTHRSTIPTPPLFPAKISNCETSRTYLKWSLIARQRVSYCHQRVDTEPQRSALNFLKGDKRGAMWRRHRRITPRAVASDMFDEKSRQSRRPALRRQVHGEGRVALAKPGSPHAFPSKKAGTDRADDKGVHKYIPSM